MLAAEENAYLANLIADRRRERLETSGKEREKERRHDAEGTTRRYKLPYIDSSDYEQDMRSGLVLRKEPLVPPSPSEPKPKKTRAIKLAHHIHGSSTMVAFAVCRRTAPDTTLASHLISPMVTARVAGNGQGSHWTTRRITG
ncbi:hypothetical protein CT0861_10626 [Colletotrichum tofieldiae]|uniref:Uncharacterized protein n=1 Tax=Colletotrichum tofieldiae TaxID=708197 RepID=A0A161W806_9PEZI|nr:hypothetical protein CT0861_10626 [Colletotrichum tofieldiae]